MNRNECVVGMRVYFGRPNGQQTLGEVVRLNPTKAKVKTLEGRGRQGQAGQLWGVPYSMLRSANGSGNVIGSSTKAVLHPLVALPPLPGTPKVGVTYNPLSEDNDLMEAVLSCYCHLSPENLSCDGEASPAWVRQRSQELHRKLSGLFVALGRNVSEQEAWEWSRLKGEYENAKKGNAASASEKVG